ncbi:dihydropteridine reductase-like [Sitophilus oryzae]|uniref:Dihydropteridine reductase n=1 Tax=Sitophilus oryzae TaxID=7048 RepID=A0A6J2XAM7_SITOR|nr:dihydropteridine reductase-like [Sitophilus oryzae]XP_030748333.1 dihydropteridine reductase-like [Sitophilus oryzae]
MSYTGRVLIYGGRGALGSKCISEFKAKSFWVGSIDLAENPEAHCSIVIKKDEDFIHQEESVVSAVGEALNGEKLDGIFCVAGGWAGGNATKNLAKNAQLMWQQSVCSSLIAATLATKYLKEGAVIQLTGAKAALDPTPNMIGYGLAKSAVHHLTKSLAGKNSGVPKNTTVVAILPVTLDTPMNRKWMPQADHSSWTPLEFIAELFLKWLNGQDKPPSGTLLQLVTENNKTNITPL